MFLAQGLWGLIVKATDLDAGLTVDRLRQRLSYSPEDGVFQWRRSGLIAGGTHHSGYHQIRIDGRLYLTHRLVWLYMTGEWPVAEIDHKDRDRSNNRWSNLREADHGENQCNAIRVVRDLPRGVYERDGKYRAQIRKHGHLTNLGTFATTDAAARAYKLAATRMHGEFTP